MSKNRLLQIVNKLGLTNKDKSDLVNIIGQEKSSNYELSAYPIDYNEESKVVKLGGEKLYNYIGEISIPSDMVEIEGVLDGDIVQTEYLFQPIYEGVMQPYFESRQEEHYFNLYIGNDKYGYTSLKVEPSEDPNNLKWYNAIGLGMWQESSGNISFAWSNFTLYYRAACSVQCNIKVYWLYRVQKLDINFIPQEIARKEDIVAEINNYKYPLVTIDVDNLTYEGEIESENIEININIHSQHYNYDIFLNKWQDGDNIIVHKNNYISISFNKKTKKIVDIFLLKPILTTYGLDDYDYKNCHINSGQCNVMYYENIYTATIDSDDFVTTLINGKYFKYKLNRETHLLQLQQEIDLNSIESRLAALEAKI